MVYLNDVEEGGETAFPVANNETYDEEVMVLVGFSSLNEQLCNKLIINNCYQSRIQSYNIFMWNYLLYKIV